MAPTLAEAAVTGSAAKEFKKESGTARLLGSGIPVYHHTFLKQLADLFRFCWNC